VNLPYDDLLEGSIPGNPERQWQGVVARERDKRARIRFGENPRGDAANRSGCTRDEAVRTLVLDDF